MATETETKTGTAPTPNEAVDEADIEPAATDIDSSGTDVEPSDWALFFEESYWIGVSSSILGGVILLIAVALYAKLRRRTNPLVETLLSIAKLHTRLSSIQVVRFNRDREDYKNTKSDGIAKYISSARSDVTIVGINLMTGTGYETLEHAIRDLTGRNVRVTISLIDPSNPRSMVSISQALGSEVEEIKFQILSTFRKLFDLNNSFPTKQKELFRIRAHSTVPFASAIIIDPDEKGGEIQIETKPYKAPMNQSFGFALQSGGSHGLFRTLVGSYQTLIDDSRPVDGANLL